MGFSKKDIGFKTLEDGDSAMFLQSGSKYIDQQINNYIQEEEEFIPQFEHDQFEETPVIEDKQNEQQDGMYSDYSGATITTFNSSNTQNFIRVIQYYEDDWVIFIQQDDTYLAVGVNCGHSFVHTNDFTFLNSDGSTCDSCPNIDNPQNIIKRAQQISKQFIVSQTH